MQVKKLGTIQPGQDGAIHEGRLFRGDADGSVRVYDLRARDPGGERAFPLIASFRLDRSDEMLPHCNAVTFGAAGGEGLPLLYANVYNSYQKGHDRREGVLCAYRLRETESGFVSRLVQVIRIGFVEDRSLWKSLEGDGDVRPYGNFAVDPERGLLAAFVMRDREPATRYFVFDLPDPEAGEPDPDLGVPCVTLTVKNIRSRFDGPYIRYMQGACCRNGILYSVEGFGAEFASALPALRTVDLTAGRETAAVDFVSLGLLREPECIDFDGNECLYSDGDGNLFRLEL